MIERALPLRGISVFEAAARAESFHAAAEELNLTPSAVSHQIRLLEAIWASSFSTGWAVA
jgi:LysR family glycine cleavage system transcriptional activator